MLLLLLSLETSVACLHGSTQCSRELSTGLHVIRFAGCLVDVEEVVGTALQSSLRHECRRRVRTVGHVDLEATLGHSTVPVEGTRHEDGFEPWLLVHRHHAHDSTRGWGQRVREACGRQCGSSAGVLGRRGAADQSSSVAAALVLTLASVAAGFLRLDVLRALGQTTGE